MLPVVEHTVAPGYIKTYVKPVNDVFNRVAKIMRKHHLKEQIGYKRQHINGV